MVLDVEAVLREVRVEDDDFVAGIEHRFQDGIDGSGGAGGHEDIVRAERQACAFRQAFRAMAARTSGNPALGM